MARIAEGGWAGIRPRQRPDQKPAVAKRIAQAINDLGGTVKVIRSTIFALHSHQLAHQGAPSVRAQVLEPAKGWPSTLASTRPCVSSAPSIP